MLRLDLNWLSAVQILGGLRGEAWAGETNLVNLVVVSLDGHWAERDAPGMSLVGKGRRIRQRQGGCLGQMRPQVGAVSV